MPEIKFCGLTRAADAACAAELGAEFGGVIFAGGPRRVDVARALAVLDGASGSALRRVGVFGAQGVEEILRTADAVDLDVVQLHDGMEADGLLMLRERFHGAVWVAFRVSGSTLDGPAEPVVRLADAVVLDTAVAGRSGGTGIAFDWLGVAPRVAVWRTTHRVVLAGGLRPTNVADAVRTLAPHVVDVSSGVESSSGIKDPLLMRAFAEAARRREER